MLNVTRSPAGTVGPLSTVLLIVSNGALDTVGTCPTNCACTDFAGVAVSYSVAVLGSDVPLATTPLTSTAICNVPTCPGDSAGRSTHVTTPGDAKGDDGAVVAPPSVALIKVTSGGSVSSRVIEPLSSVPTFLYSRV